MATQKITSELQIKDTNITGAELEELTDGSETTLHSHAGTSAAVSNANNLFYCNACGTSAFVGTIATLPGGAVLTYNVTSGNENAMVPVATTQLAKMRLYNTTRATSALISNCVIGTNTITLTANVPAGWQVGDTITIASQTVVGTYNWVDLEITSGEFLGKANVFITVRFTDTGGAGSYYVLHPFEAYAISKITANESTQSTQTITNQWLYKLTSNIISIGWAASGAATAQITIVEAGYL